MENKGNIYGQELWSYYDSIRTFSSVRFQSFISKNDFGYSSLMFTIAINNSTNKIYNTIVLKYADIFKYFNSVKSLCENKIPKDFTINLNKKSLTTKFTKADDTGNAVQILISGKGDDEYQSDTIFIPLPTFVPVIKIMQQIKDNYVNLTFMAKQEAIFDGLGGKMDTLKEKLNNLDITQRTVSDLMNNKSEVVVESDIDQTNIDTSPQEEMTKYLAQNRDSVKFPELDDIDSNEPTEAQVSTSNGLTTDFTKDILGNDMTMLDVTLSNIATQVSPIKSFINFITDKDIEESKDDVMPNCNDNMYKYILYANSVFTKNIASNFLYKKSVLPSSVLPMFYRNEGDINDKQKELVYDLMMYYCVYHLTTIQLSTKVKSDVKNKSLQFFLYKSMTAPMIFSFFKDIRRTELVENVVNKFKIYKKNNVFKEFIIDIKQNLDYSLILNEGDIEKTCDTIFMKITGNWERFNIADISSENKLSNHLKIDYNGFNKLGSLTHDDIDKVIYLEEQYMAKGQINTKAVDDKYLDLPENILEIYGIGQSILKKDNLIKYLNEVMGDEWYSERGYELIDRIETDFDDLVGFDFDYHELGDDVLKALKIWYPTTDPKLTTDYNYFVSVVKECVHDRESIVASIMATEEDIENEGDMDFTGAMNLT